VPFAPKSLTNGVSSRLLAEATTNLQDGTYWGNFHAVNQVAINYNSTLRKFEEIMDSISTDYIISLKMDLLQNIQVKS